jgi:hypothetical protein
MRKKFKILYPNDYFDETKRGTKYDPGPGKMIIMNTDGIFFVYDNTMFYPSIKKLSKVLPKYDVTWK